MAQHPEEKDGPQQPVEITPKQSFAWAFDENRLSGKEPGPAARDAFEWTLRRHQLQPALVAECLAEAARRYVQASYDGEQTPEQRQEVEAALEAYSGDST